MRGMASGFPIQNAQVSPRAAAFPASADGIRSVPAALLAVNRYPRGSDCRRSAAMHSACPATPSFLICRTQAARSEQRIGEDLRDDVVELLALLRIVVFPAIGTRRSRWSCSRCEPCTTWPSRFRGTPGQRLFRYAPHAHAVQTAPGNEIRIGDDFLHQFTVLQQHLNDLTEVALEPVERFRLSMGSGESGHIGHMKAGVGTFLGDRGKSA